MDSLTKSELETSAFHADYLEHFEDDIEILNDIWFADHIIKNQLDAPDEACRIVADFVGWLKNEQKRKLHAKLAPDNKSFFERRENAIS